MRRDQLGSLVGHMMSLLQIARRKVAWDKFCRYKGALFALICSCWKSEKGIRDNHHHWRRSSSPSHYRDRGSRPSSPGKRKKVLPASLDVAARAIVAPFAERSEESDGLKPCQRLLLLPVVERRKEILLLQDRSSGGDERKVVVDLDEAEMTATLLPKF